MILGNIKDGTMIARVVASLILTALVPLFLAIIGVGTFIDWAILRVTGAKYGPIPKMFRRETNHE